MTQAPLPDSATNSRHRGDGSIFGPVHITRTIIIVTGILCAVVFYYAARWIGWPREPGFGGSMAQSKAILSFLGALVLLIVCTIGATILAGRRWFLAGLMAATAGLATWSVRGGTMTAVLFNAQTSGTNHVVFLKMIGELIVFFGVIGALWNLIWNANSELMMAGDISPEARIKQAARFRIYRFLCIAGPAGDAIAIASRINADANRSEEGRSTGTALLAQLAIMLILMMLFVVIPLKKQVLTSVFISGVIATAIAEYFFADRKAGRWYWIAPLVIGVIGYVAGYVAPLGLETGDLQGVFAPLARVLPLDYASMGCAGVLFGYWWMEPDGEGDEPAAVEAGVPGRPSKSPSGNAGDLATDAA